MYYVPQDAQSSVYRKWAAIHCSRWNLSTSVGYLAVVFTRYGNRSKGIDTRITNANAVLRDLCCAVVKTGGFANLSVFKAVFVSILVCGHELRVTTKRILSQEQVAEMGFLRRVQDVTLRDKMHRFEIRKARNVTPHFLIRKIQAGWFDHVSRLAQERFTASPAGCIGGKAVERFKHQVSRDYISDLAWSRLGVDRGELSETAVDREIFRVHVELLPRDPPQRKSGQEHWWMNEYGHWKCLFIKLSSFFAKSECRVQIIRCIETWIFMKIS